MAVLRFWLQKHPEVWPVVNKYSDVQRQIYKAD